MVQDLAALGSFEGLGLGSWLQSDTICSGTLHPESPEPYSQPALFERASEQIEVFGF